MIWLLEAGCRIRCSSTGVAQNIRFLFMKKKSDAEERHHYPRLSVASTLRRAQLQTSHLSGGKYWSPWRKVASSSTNWRHITCRARKGVTVEWTHVSPKKGSGLSARSDSLRSFYYCTTQARWSCQDHEFIGASSHYGGVKNLWARERQRHRTKSTPNDSRPDAQ